MIERGFDETTGIIRVTASGDWDAAEIDDHYVQLRVLIDAVRARGLPVRVLVDVRAASPRSPLVEAQIADKKHATYSRRTASPS